MDYPEAIRYLESTIRYGINPDLQRITSLCQAMGNPELSFPVIHITGTNGKTSTARIISRFLFSLGLKVGTYTSPHLESCTERIELNIKSIEEKEFALYLSKLIPYIERLNRSQPLSLTYFEILTGLAFLYFADQAIDCGVIEVGMGGIWDATNLVRPKVAVITNVQLDHTDMLGKTVPEIAMEKAGIIKQGCQVITSEKQAEVLEIIGQKCLQEGVELKILGRDFSFLVKSSDGTSQHLRIKGLFDDYDNLFLPLSGSHQAENAATAVVATEAFLGKPLPEQVLEKGLAYVTSPGRLEMVRTKPMVILDGAHNPAGALCLARALKSNFSYQRLILVLAILGDKDVRGIIEHLVPLAQLTILSQNQNSRSASADSLAQEVGRLGKDFLIEADLSAAIDLALSCARPEDLICITGSLYTIGEARRKLLGEIPPTPLL